MQNVELTRGHVLWNQGEPARTIGVVNRGKLAARSERRIVGILYRGMVFGEAALLGIEGHVPDRTVSVYALEDDTSVTEYPAGVVKDMLDGGLSTVAAPLLRTLVGQICRNWLLVASAHEGREFVAAPAKAFAEALVASIPRLEKIDNWPDFQLAFRFLYGLRDLTESDRDRMVAPRVETFDAIASASHVMRWLFADQHVQSYLQDFLAAEEERRKLQPAN